MIKNKRNIIIASISGAIAIIALVLILVFTLPKEHKVSFMVGDETFSTIKTKGKEEITLPENPAKDGYTFEGWFTDKDVWKAEFTKDSLVDTKLSEDMYVHAYFLKKNGVEGTDVQIEDFESKLVDGEESLHVDVANSKEDLDFTDIVKVSPNATWTMSSDKEGNNTIANNKTDLEVGKNTLYLHVTDRNGNKKTYKIVIEKKAMLTVSFDADGGSACDDQEVEEGSKLEALPTTTKTGYTFAGWYNSDDKVDINTFVVNSEATLKAHWTANTYKLTFDYNYDGKADKVSDVDYDDELTLEAPTRDYYKFEGWYDGDTKVENAYTYKTVGNKTLVAHWSEAEYTITYVLNDSTNDTLNKASYTYFDDNFKLKAPTKKNYKFLGWKNVTTKGEPTLDFTLDTSLARDLVIEAVFDDSLHTASNDALYEMEYAVDNIYTDEAVAKKLDDSKESIYTLDTIDEVTQYKEDFLKYVDDKLKEYKVTVKTNALNYKDGIEVPLNEEETALILEAYNSLMDEIDSANTKSSVDNRYERFKGLVDELVANKTALINYRNKAKGEIDRNLLIYSDATLVAEANEKKEAIDGTEDKSIINDLVQEFTENVSIAFTAYSDNTIAAMTAANDALKLSRVGARELDLLFNRTVIDLTHCDNKKEFDSVVEEYEIEKAKILATDKLLTDYMDEKNSSMETLANDFNLESVTAAFNTAKEDILRSESKEEIDRYYDTFYEVCEANATTYKENLYNYINTKSHTFASETINNLLLDSIAKLETLDLLSELIALKAEFNTAMEAAINEYKKPTLDDVRAKYDQLLEKGTSYMKTIIPGELDPIIKNLVDAESDTEFIGFKGDFNTKYWNLDSKNTALISDIESVYGYIENHANKFLTEEVELELANQKNKLSAAKDRKAMDAIYDEFELYINNLYNNHRDSLIAQFTKKANDSLDSLSLYGQGRVKELVTAIESNMNSGVYDNKVELDNAYNEYLASLSQRIEDDKPLKAAVDAAIQLMTERKNRYTSDEIEDKFKNYSSTINEQYDISNIESIASDFVDQVDNIEARYKEKAISAVDKEAGPGNQIESIVTLSNEAKTNINNATSELAVNSIYEEFRKEYKNIVNTLKTNALTTIDNIYNNALPHVVEIGSYNTDYNNAKTNIENSNPNSFSTIISRFEKKTKEYWIK